MPAEAPAMEMGSSCLQGDSERDECTPHRRPGRSGVYMQSAESRKDEPGIQVADASPEELEAARASAQMLVSKLLPAFAALPGDHVLAVAVDVVDLVMSAGLASDDRDLNPDPLFCAPHRVLRRYYTRSQARAALLVDPHGGSTERPTLPTPTPLRRSGDRDPPDRVSKKARTDAHTSSSTGPAPPQIPYVIHHTNVYGDIAHPSPSQSESFVYAPVSFTLDRLTYRPPTTSARDMRPPAALVPFPPLKKKRNSRMCDLARTARRNLARTTAVLTPQPSTAPALETLNVAQSGHCGFIPRLQRDAVRAVFGTPDLVPLLETMHVVPYDFENETDTAICDRNTRCVTLRSKVVADIRPGESLINKLTTQIQQFIAHCPIPARDREANKRGHHYAAIMGVHRQYAEKPFETAFHRKYRTEIDWLMSPGSALSRYTLMLTILVERRFPSLAQRMLNNAKWHYDNSKINGRPLLPQFGLFWNCCINAPSPEVGVERVVATPHADSRNVAALFCALLAYWADGLVGEDEWSWLVLWELGIILQCPRGAFILYPSALLLHFNVRIVKCKKGERPTPANSTSIYEWVEGGRGSIVWYSQATMYSYTDEGQDGRSHEERIRELMPVVLDPSTL